MRNSNSRTPYPTRAKRAADAARSSAQCCAFARRDACQSGSLSTSRYPTVPVMLKLCASAR
jgi:hypothetical protein